MDRLEKIVNVTTSSRKLGFLKRLLIGGALYTAGCAGIPAPGEFHEKTTVSFPHHPIVVLLDAGEIRCKRTYDERGKENGYTVAKHHWLLGKQGEQRIDYPSGSKNFGSNAWGCILFSTTNQTYDLNGQRFLKTYDMDNNCKTVKKTEKSLIEKRDGKWEKVKSLP